MTNIDTRIEGSQKLTRIFGYWPTFHDAEVLEFNLWRGNVNPDKAQYTFPIVTARIHLWEITGKVDANGYYVLQNHLLATIRFHDVEECRMEGFNHQNAILGLDVTEEHRSQGTTPVFNVTFRPAFGIDASLKCSRVEVIEAVPCSEHGIPHP